MYINNIIEIQKVNIIFFLIQKFCHPLKEQFSNDILARVCNYTAYRSRTLAFNKRFNNKILTFIICSQEKYPPPKHRK